MDAPCGAQRVRVTAKRGTEHADQMMAARRLLHQAGLGSFGQAVLVGSVYFLDDPDPEDPAISDYVLPRFDALGTLARDCGADVEDLTTVTWDGTDLTVEFSRNRRAYRRVEATALSPAQLALAKSLTRAYVAGGPNPCAQALQVGDAAAAVASQATPMWGEEEERDPDDPLGFLQFADTLTRAGVESWPSTQVGRLAHLAEGWSFGADELLSVAADLGIPPHV